MALVTLIGEKLAKKDNEFFYIGPNNECRNCKLKTVCFNLKTGMKYKIINVREKRHNCNVHEGTVAVVEVEELPIITTVEKKCKEGDEIQIEKEECNNIGCEYYELCKIKISKDKKYEIIKVHGKIDCPIELNLEKVEIKQI